MTLKESSADSADRARIRLDNALVLFDEFVAQNVRTPDASALRGLERRFAEQLLIQPSYWSQIKSRHRQIGERLARQFETRCRKPLGWMDVPHLAPDAPVFALQVSPPTAAEDTSSQPRDDDERFIVGLVLSYYRRHPQRARQRLLDLLSEVLAPPASAVASARGPHAETSSGASAAGDDSHDLWLRSQTGVSPLKPRR